MCVRPTRFRSSLVGRVEQVGRGVAGQKQAPDLPLQHLAARPQRHRVAQHQLARPHVLSETRLPHKLRQLGPQLRLELGRRRRVRDDRRDNALAQGHVGQPEDRRLRHERAGEQRPCW